MPPRSLGALLKNGKLSAVAACEGNARAFACLQRKNEAALLAAPKNPSRKAGAYASAFKGLIPARGKSGRTAKTPDEYARLNQGGFPLP